MLLLSHARCIRTLAKTGIAAYRFSTSSRIQQKQGEPFRILFCGSDEFSVASLKAVHEARDLWSSIDVVVPAEREVGRGGKGVHRHTKYIPALREYSDKHSLPVSTIPSTGIKGWSPPSPFTSAAQSHLLLTASFGHIIPLKLLNLFPEDQRLNVHPSLLPRWRGAAPVQWTIAYGDVETGVSVQRLVRYGKGIDSGDIVSHTSGIAVPKDATYNTLLPHLADVGGRLLVDALRRIRDGAAAFTPQDETHITLAPKITHDTARIRWSEQDANTIDRLYRGIHHQYPLWTTIHGVSAQLHDLQLVEDTSLESTDQVVPGTAILQKQGKARRLHVVCAGQTWLEVGAVQMAGKKALPIKDWWNGLPKDVRDSGRAVFE